MSRRPRGPEPWDAPPRPKPSTRFERSARFWLNAYPRRWRDLHGDELIGVLEAVARDDGIPRTSRLPKAEIRGLLRAGLSLRLRERPPFWRWLAYRGLSMRLPARYWWWAADDIRSPWYPVIEGVSRGAGMIAGVLFVELVVLPGGDTFFGGPGWWAWAVYVAMVGGISYLCRNEWRRHAWYRHVVDGNVPESIRATWTGAGTMAPGVDPAITGESPEERPSQAQ